MLLQIQILKRSTNLNNFLATSLNFNYNFIKSSILLQGRNAHGRDTPTSSSNQELAAIEAQKELRVEGDLRSVWPLPLRPVPECQEAISRALDDRLQDPQE